MSRQIPFSLICLLAALVYSPAAFAADEVALVHAIGSDCPPDSGCHRDVYFTGHVRVANLGVEKNVVIVYQSANSTWQTLEAQYLYSSPNGTSDVFTFSLANYVPTKFAVAYTVGEVTYWDNNNGSDYQLWPYQYDVVLGASTDIARPWENPWDADSIDVVQAHIFVKNRHHDKSLNAIYTDNDWNSVRIATGQYSSTLPSGVEVWTFALPLPSDRENNDSVQLAFRVAYPWILSWASKLGLNYSVDDLVP